jgi:hypothetical protein
VLALAACGGGGAPTLTKAEYASKLSRLCLVAADQLRELHLDISVAAWKADGPRVVAIEQSFNHKLAALKAPDSIKTAVTAYTKANDKGFRDTEDAVAAAKAGDANKFHAELTQANKDNLATGAPAKAIGAQGCYIG